MRTRICGISRWAYLSGPDLWTCKTRMEMRATRCLIETYSCARWRDQRHAPEWSVGRHSLSDTHERAGLQTSISSAIKTKTWAYTNRRWLLVNGNGIVVVPCTHLTLRKEFLLLDAQIHDLKYFPGIGLEY